MNVFATVLCRIGNFLLSIVRALRKIICCRRKKEAEYLLPMTVGHIIDMEQNTESGYVISDFNSHWEAWPEREDNAKTSTLEETQNAQSEITVQEDYFKDMVPQIRKPKKIFIRNEMKTTDQISDSSNRLALDPNAILTEADLGIIDDNPSNWEDIENEMWEPDLLLREKKRAEQEKRRADHQRKKMEKDNRRSSKPESLSSIMLNLSDSKEKPKNS